MLADFVAEFSLPADEEAPLEWTLSVDSASNMKGGGMGVILEGPGNLLITQALNFEFKASNN